MQLQFHWLLLQLWYIFLALFDYRHLYNSLDLYAGIFCFFFNDTVKIINFKDHLSDFSLWFSSMIFFITIISFYSHFKYFIIQEDLFWFNFIYQSFCISFLYNPLTWYFCICSLVCSSIYELFNWNELNPFS